MNTVLITGASTGIGYETALLFAKKGWHVAATMRNTVKGASLAKLPNVSVYQLDITDPASIHLCIQNVLKDLGKIDVLVNNAGVYVTKPLEALADEEIADQLNTNVSGILHTIKAILPHFKEQKSGTIVNLSSVAGRTTFPFQTLYHGTKWAVEGISESLSYELEPFGIRVKLVEPGMVKTNLWDSSQQFPSGAIPQDYNVAFGNWHKYLLKSIASAYGPDVTAKTVYRAATASGKRLRFSSGPETSMVLFLRGLLPFPLFRGLMKRMSGI